MSDPFVSAARITWEPDGEGLLDLADDLHVTVRASTRAYPPGASPNGHLHVGGAPVRFTLKVAGSKREADGFIVRGRLVNATVAIRAAFATAPRATPVP